MSTAEFFRAYDRVLATWPVQVEQVDVVSRYGTTRVNVCGSGSPLVLLPGGGATSTVWWANVAALSRTRRVFAVDPIGQPGRSTAGSEPIRHPDDLMSWLSSVLDGLDIDRADVVGHSYGAMIALAYSLSAPSRVRNLVLLDPNSCFAGMNPMYVARAIPLLLRPTYRRQLALIEWETGGAALDEDWVHLLGLGAADFPSAKTVVPRRPSGQSLRSVANATVILAANSKVHNATRVRGKVPDKIRTVVVPGCSHHTMPFDPSDEIDKIILDALV